MFNANDSSMDDTCNTFAPYQDNSKEMNNTAKSIMIIFSLFKEQYKNIFSLKSAKNKKTRPSPERQHHPYTKKECTGLQSAARS